MDLVEANINKLRTENRHPWEDARVELVSHLMRKYCNPDKDFTIMDIGSGDSYVAHNFTKKFSGASAYCVDIEYTPQIIGALQNLYKNDHLNLYDSLDSIDKDNLKANAVTILDVIEHVPDDVKLLTQVSKSKHVKSGETYVFITVPAFQSMFSQHDILLKHYRRYNMKLLKKSIEQSNLLFIEGGYFFSSLLLPRILALAGEKLSSKEKELEHLGTWDGSKFVTKGIKNILVADYKFGQLMRKIGINIPGLSCYAVCKVE